MVTREQAEEKIKLGFIIHFLVYLVVVGSLMAMNFTRHPENMWSVWVACGWGLGVLFHGVNAFSHSHSHERMIQRTINRLERGSRAQ